MIDELESESKLESYLLPLEARDDVTDFKLSISEEYKQKYHLKAGATFIFLVNGKGFELSVGLDDDFPYSMPHIFFKKEFYGIYPHIEKNGWVCYYKKQGLVVDVLRPNEILNHALELVRDKIIGLSNSKTKAEIFNEFEAYLNRIEGIRYIKSYLQIDSNLREIVFVEGDDAAICEFESQIDSFRNHKIERDFRVRNAIYLPLENQYVEPPLNEFWTLEEIKTIVQRNLTNDHRENLKKLLKKRKLGNREFLLISIPRQGKEKILVGIDFHYTQNEYPILENGLASKIYPYRIHRLDSNFLLNRGGATNQFEKKDILLVGVGSIGGFIAKGLAEMGVKKITLVDNDSLEYGNLYRHLLGRSFVGKKKSFAVKSYLESNYPFLELNSFHSEIMTLIKEGEIDLKKYNMVIVALGNPIVEMHLNKFFKELDLSKVIFTWLEPMDVGGHMLTLNYTEHGCYKCLYGFEEVKGTLELYNRASFLAAGQNFEKDMEGCGTSFSPYGVISAKKTANLVIENVSKILRSDKADPMIISWKGKSEQVEENDYKVSKRYHLSNEMLNLGGKSFVREDCEVCSAK